MRGLVLLVACAAAAGCSEDLVDGTFTHEQWAIVQTLSPLPEVPGDPTDAVADDPDAAALGQALFFDPRASGPLLVGDDGANGGLGAVGDTGKVSCSSCHLPGSAWLDDTRSRPDDVSLAAGWGTRNAPTLVNAAFYAWYGWSGRNDTMWNQACGTTESSVSHHSTRLAVAHVIYDHYKAPYEALFGPLDPRLDPASPSAGDFPATGKPGDAAFDAMPAADQDVVDRIFTNYGKVLEAYDRTLVSRNAPFDRYVAGDTTAISDAAKHGLQLFVGEAGCVACHDTPLFSDSEFHDLGVQQTGDHIPSEDLGRYSAVASLMADPLSSAGAYSDDPTVGKIDGLVLDDALKGEFRTKHLREIAGTAPYMHTGQLATLHDVVDFYDYGGGDSVSGTKDPRIQPLGLGAEDEDDLVAFLETLAGDPVDPALLVDTSAP